PGPMVGVIMDMLLERRIEDGPYSEDEAFAMVSRFALETGLPDPGETCFRSYSHMRIIRRMFKTAVFGASGYAGGELVRILDDHEAFDLVHLGAHSREGSRLADVHPQLRGGDRVLGSNDPATVDGLDVAFLALPHGASAEVGRVLRHRGVVVVDLGSDYRLDSDSRYQSAYGAPHPYPAELADWV